MENQIGMSRKKIDRDLCSSSSIGKEEKDVEAEEATQLILYLSSMFYPAAYIYGQAIVDFLFFFSMLFLFVLFLSLLKSLQTLTLYNKW